jgi:hypothetical protein
MFSHVGYLLMYNYALYMVASTACGASRPFYEDAYMVGGRGDGYFVPT